MLRADFHCHTIVSYDCCTTIDELVRRCEKVGINCLAVTDHNEIEGALRVRDRASFKVIIGEEIFSADGEVIGLFLKEKIKPRLPLLETMQRIKDQGGLVYLPHPVSGIRKSKLSAKLVTDNAGLIDIVEAHNARTLFQTESETEWVRRLIDDNKLVVAGASDAHCVWEFGNVIVEMADFTTPEEFLAGLRNARINFRQSPSWIRVLLNNKVRKLIRRVRQHGG
jgi:predicted metal-dependent phosphoesterase TrpH